MFKIKSIFSTLQGEGSKSGTPAIFVRFTGCNLWSGKESSRKKAKGHCGLWCDTDFVGGHKYDSDKLFSAIEAFAEGNLEKCVVFTGGEPLLQLKDSEGLDLVKKLLFNEYTVCIETNGTIKNSVSDYLSVHPKGHVTVSPKPLMDFTSNIDHLELLEGTDLKIIVPTSFNLKEYRVLPFENFYLQPKDSKNEDKNKKNTLKCIELAREFGYKVSLQTHKFIGIE